MRDLELYIHIPFCVRKCAYCDFLSMPADIRRQEEYLRALKREICLFPRREEYRVSTVFFGGGTPSVLPARWIAELMELIRREFRLETGAEVTLECNPGTADAQKLRIYREAGISRLSLGLQSADGRELELLGRIHTWEDFLRTYDAAREAGFENINTDLMSALPGQTVQSWERTLRRVLALKPPHISAYSLIIEEGTPFYERYREDDELRARGEQPRLLPSEEEERRMYRFTEELLAEAGLRRYEISNYALPGYECRHNIGYWTGAEYAGFGLGASSFLRLVCVGETQRGCTYERIRNTEDMEAYLAGDVSQREIVPLSVEDRIEEFMFLGLRMIRGVSEAEFREQFGRSVDEVYAPVLRRLCALGLLVRREGRIALTERGLDLSNPVMAEFLL